MKNFTISSHKTIKIWAVCFWLIVWQVVSSLVGQEILLVSPVAVLIKLFSFLPVADFWKSIGYSFVHIIGGFFIAMLAGIVTAVLAYRFTWVQHLLAPLVLVIKSIPVASFIIVALIWISSKNLAVFIAFLMCYPIMYTNVLQGLCNTSKKLLEMAELFRVSRWKKARYIYFPQTIGYYRSACSVSLGLCWKSGIAAEVIGLPDGSIGDRLYHAKIYLMTADLFAWTVVIILLSVGFEKIFLKAISLIDCR